MSSENAEIDISHYFILKISFLMHQEDNVLIFSPTVLWFVYLFIYGMKHKGCISLSLYSLFIMSFCSY